MTALEIIRQIIAEKKQSGKVPYHALRLEILKRFHDGSVDDMDDELRELSEWTEIICIRTINDVAFREIEDSDIEVTTSSTVEDITNN